MTNWDNLLELYYDDMNRNLIGRLIGNYEKILKEDNYQGFSLKSEEQLLSDIHQMNALGKEEDEGSFLYSFADFLRYKAEGIEGERAYEKYLERFEVIDQPYIKELIAYYKDKNYDFSRLQGEVELKNIASDIAGLTFPYTFWEGFVRSLKLRVEKLKEASPEEVIQQFREYFPYDDRELVNQMLNPLYEADSYFSLYSLSKSEARKLAKGLREYFFHSNAPEIFSDLLYKRLQQVQEENYAETELMDALRKLYPVAMQEGVKAFVETLMKTYGAEAVSQLVGKVSVDYIKEAVTALAANHPFFLGIAAWFIETAKAYLQKTEQELLPFIPDRKEVVVKITNEFIEELSNYLVKIYDTATGKLLGQAVTQSLGFFKFSYLPAFTESDKGDVQYLDQEVRFEIIDPLVSEDAIDTITQTIPFDQKEIEITASFTKPEAPQVEMDKVMGLPDSQALRDYAREKKLSEIRMVGSFSNLEGADEFKEESWYPEFVKRIDAHAELNFFSPDLILNEKAISEGFDSTIKIAEATREEFVQKIVAEDPGDDQLYASAAILHQKAATTQAFTQALELLERSAEASYYSAGSGTASGNAHMQLTADNAMQKCTCDGCQTAVSPAAYLNALLAYTSANVKAGSQAATTGILKTNFRQKFAELANYCAEATERYVCQIRVAIETIREYVTTDISADKKAPYLNAVYNTLLGSLGTNIDELKQVITGLVNADNLVKTKSQEKLRKLSDRMGLSEQFITNGLYLKPAPSGSSRELNESNLEILFGLQNTFRNQFATGAIVQGDPNLAYWEFRGMQWLKNTDKNGYIHIHVSATKVDIYKEPGGRQLYGVHLVASGKLEPANSNGIVKAANIYPVNGSELYGELQFKDDPLNDITTISLIPEVVAQQFLYQENSWKAEKQANVQTGFIIDPDLIGPDDIRNPEVDLAPGKQVFDLWKNRRILLDDISTKLAKKVFEAQSSNNTSSEIEKTLNYIAGKNLEYLNLSGNDYPVNNTLIHWDITNNLLNFREPINSTATTAAGLIADLYKQYQVNVADESVLKLIRNGAQDGPNNDGSEPGFGFTVESFVYLNELWAKSLTTSLSDEEKIEVVNILTQTFKASLKHIFLAEEVALKTSIAATLGVNATTFSLLNPTVFYAPIHEPAVGEWKKLGNEVASKAVPYIDPENFSVKDLPDPAFGETAKNLLNHRKGELRAQFNAILAAKSGSTIGAQSDAMFATAYSAPNPGFPTGYASYDEVYEVLIQENHRDYAAIVNFITNVLKLTVEEYQRIFAIRQKNATEKDWETHAAILTTAWKRKVKYTTGITGWIATEGDEYWKLYKHHLTKWRATEAQRNNWKEAVKALSQLPVIDPDQVADADFLHPELDDTAPKFNPAYGIYNNRVTTLASWETEVKQNQILAYKINRFVFGCPTAQSFNDHGLEELKTLHNLYLDNVDVTARLRQLNLSIPALDYLITQEAAYSQPTGNEAVKAEVENILLQCRKERYYSIWCAEENKAGIIVSDLYFKEPFSQAAELNVYLNTILKPWRSNPRNRQDWQNLLSARIEQRKSLAAQAQQAVENAEDLHLITLRNALLLHSTITSASTFKTVEENAKWLSDKLLMDFSTNCCQKTTRLAQAIEVLQKMYFLIRNGDNTFGNNTFTISNPNLEKDWQWLGSYESWRSLMFVYLYPENLLQPSFKPVQTEKFREIVQRTRENLRFTPADACHLMHEYEDYMQEIASLQLKGSARAFVEATRDGCATNDVLLEQVNFQVAISKSRKVYWNTYTRITQQAGKVSTWKAVPNLEKVESVIGAATYITPTRDRYFYVFAVVKKEKDKKAENQETQPDKQLVAARYNLATASWEDSLVEFTIPDNTPFDELVLTHREWEGNTLTINGIYKIGPSIWPATNKPISDYLNANIRSKIFDYKLFSLEVSADGVEIKRKFDANIYFASELSLLAALTLTHEMHFCFVFKYKVPGALPEVAYSIKDMYNGKSFSISPGKYPITNFIPNNIGGSVNAYLVNKTRDEGSCLLHSLDSVGLTGKFKGLVRIAGKSFYFIHDKQVGNSSIPHRFNLELPANLENTPIYPTVVPYPLADISYIGPDYQYVDKSGKGQAPMVTVSQRAVPSSEGRTINVIQVSNAGNTNLLPKLTDCPALLTKLDANSQNNRRQKVSNLIQLNANAPKEVQAYAEEAYYYLPLHLALELQKGKHYEEALKYFRLVYDYQLPLANRKIYYGLTKEEQNGDLMGNALTWLNNPDNPHTIGALRSNSYTRFTLTSIARCIMEFADQEFTRDTAESVPRAKALYELAEELLAYEMKRFDFESCEALLKETDALVPDVRWQPEWERLKEMLRQIGLKNEISKILKNDFTDNTIPSNPVPYRAINMIFSDTTKTWENKIEEAEEAIEARMQLLPPANIQPTGSTGTQSGTAYYQYSAERTGLTYKAVGEAVMGMGDYTAERFSNAVNTIKENTGINHNKGLGGTEAASGPIIAAKQSSTKDQINWDGFLGMSGVLNRPYVPFLEANFCVPNNPVPHSLYLYVQLSLFKIRNCMNIAGMKRELDPYAAPTDATSGMPMIGANGRITYPGRLVVPATQYRYSVLVERTRQLVSIAQQVENALLSTLEKRDGEYYSQLKARQDIQTGKATVKLQDLRIKEAQDGVELAKMQKQRSQIMETAYQEWINAGLNKWEESMITNYDIAAYASIASAGFQAIIQASEIDLGDLLTFGATKISDGVVVAGKFAADSAAIIANTTAQIASIRASHARREQEWTLQKNLATQDLKIGDQQIKLSEDRVRITGQEKVISALQLEHSEDTLNFLLTKFTSAELYDWMSRVLEGVYNYFLQQATVMAKLAEQQLAFERQESPAGYIQSDYWAAPADNLSYSAENTKQADRKGLTGSVRLLQDVTKLDQYAFETNKRKLQLTKTLSLAQLFPVEFARFKQTGRLPFSTLQTWFDRDFPGQYLRVIRRVKTSVIALVPPTDGIKAKLETSGISRVVVNGTQPQTVIMPRPGESVSYTSPMNATGLFELEQQPGEMLYPFEGMGVEANWEFIMEPGSNMLDFSAIADVLIAVDYTALESYDHARNIKAELNLNNKVILERSFSFKNNFPDQWFDLNHASETADPFTVAFELSRQDFPLNLKDVKIRNLSLLVDTHEVKDRDGLVLKLHKVDPANPNSIAWKEGLTNSFGLISSKTGKSASSSSYNLYSGNGKAWGSFTQVVPEGTWKLLAGDSTVSNDKLRSLMQQGKVNDLIFIVEFEGEGPTFLEIK